MRMSIVGGGGIGTLLAAEFASVGHEVTVLTRDPGAWDARVVAVDREENLLYEGEVSRVTDFLVDAVVDQEIIWVTYPTFMLPSFAQRVLPLVRPGQCICVIPGNDAEFFFSKHVVKGVTLVGLQRVHSVARLKERGRSVYMLGRKPSVQIAALPSRETSKFAQVISELLDLPVEELSNYLVETLTPSNPLLHTARIRSMFAGWREGCVYRRNFLFYEDWDDESSELLLSCDDELQKLCRVLESVLSLDLSQVKSLREHYESPDVASLTEKIASIPAFRGLSSPMKEEFSGGWVPDFDSRYFRADFGFGLKAICDIANCVDVDVPNIRGTLDWYLDNVESPDLVWGIPDSVDGLRSLYD